MKRIDLYKKKLDEAAEIIAKRDATITELRNKIQVKNTYLRNNKKRKPLTMQRLRESNLALTKNNKTLKYLLRQKAKKNKSVAASAREVKKRAVREVEYLAKDRDIGNDMNQQQLMEIIFRTVLTYQGLIRGQIISFDEFVLLLVGYQLQAFDKEDVRSKSPHLSGKFWAVFRDLREAGLFARMYRKEKYYLTALGRQRLNDILKYIYENKVGTYKLLRRLFELEEN